jgi:transcriptional regulator with XRE-family HTH domain
MSEEQRNHSGISELQADQATREMLAKVRKRTRASLAKKLNVSKGTVSRIEKRTDLYLSTLRSYVEGVGGKLSLIVEFPDHPPVILAGLGETAGEGKKKTKKKTRTAAKSKAGTPRAA